MTFPLAPHLDPESEAFWAAAAQGRLLLPRCGGCGWWFFPPRARCPRCWSEAVELREASGRAAVLTFTVVRRNDVPPFSQRVPYVVAVVETEEGARMTTAIVGAEPEAVAIGMPVVVDFQRVDERTVLPVFRPA